MIQSDVHAHPPTEPENPDEERAREEQMGEAREVEKVVEEIEREIHEHSSDPRFAGHARLLGRIVSTLRSLAAELKRARLDIQKVREMHGITVATAERVIAERNEARALAETWIEMPPQFQHSPDETELHLFAMYLYAKGQREKREAAEGLLGDAYNALFHQHQDVSALLDEIDRALDGEGSE